MRYQDHIVTATKEAAKEAFRYAKATAPDQLDWKPLDAGRSVLDQCREMTMAPKWAISIINGEEMDWSEEAQAAAHAEQEQWKTVEECETECFNRLEGLFELFQSITDERLKETKWLPYDGGRDFTVAEMMDYPRWNCNYHLGQICYIQTLYGDKEMH